MACPCGLMGDGCSTLELGLTDISQAMKTPCGPRQSCMVLDRNTTCGCLCGTYGDNCELVVTPLGFNWFIGIVLPLGYMVGAMWYFRREHLKSNRSTFDLPSSLVTTSPWAWCSSRTLFIYRAAVLLYWTAMHIHQEIITSDRLWLLTPFTIWNSFFFLFHFAVATAVSWRAWMFPRDPDAKMDTLDILLWVTLQIELPTSIFVAAVTWLALYPISVVGHFTHVFVNFDSLNQHAGNVILISVEFMLSNLYLRGPFASFMVLWAATYATFHGVYMAGRAIAGTGHCPLYFFMDMSNPYLFFFLNGLIGLLYVFFLLGKSLSNCKERVAGTANKVGAYSNVLDDDYDASDSVEERKTSRAGDSHSAKSPSSIAV